VVLAACAACGYALKHASAALQASRSLVAVAVAQDGHALKFASDALRRDAGIVALACRQNRTALRYALPAATASLGPGASPLCPPGARQGSALAEAGARGLARAARVTDDAAGTARRGVVERGYAEFEE
jgi:hypothetical protein